MAAAASVGLILVKAVVRLEFVEALHPWIELRDLIRVAQQDRTAELQGQPIVVLRQDRKERVTIQIRGLVLEQEAPRSLSQSISQAVAVLNDFNHASPFPQLRFWRSDAMFVQSYSLAFHELVARTKEHYFRTDTLVSDATDVGINFDIAEAQAVRHVQIGPMVPEQLRSQFLVFPRDRLPAQFLFMGLGRSRTSKDPFQYEPESLEAFLRESSTWQSSEGRTIAATIIEGRRP